MAVSVAVLAVSLVLPLVIAAAAWLYFRGAASPPHTRSGDQVATVRDALLRDAALHPRQPSSVRRAPAARTRPKPTDAERAVSLPGSQDTVHPVIEGSSRDVGRPQSFGLDTIEQVFSWSAGFSPYNTGLCALRPRLDSIANRPKLLVCHDMMGGYVQDKHPQGDGQENIFRLYHWHLIDLFVYFAHRLVTIPPPGWINCAHRNGALVLGTFITEWDEGYKVCREIFKDKGSCEAFADKLVEIAVYHGFEGWLINIENKIDPGTVPVVHHFCGYLTTRMRRATPNSQVIWYDSVTAAGDLRWQDQLNAQNRIFFEVCDGIFLNYTWKAGHLARSELEARHRSTDVYVGIDVFGRGTFGGGGFNTYKAVDEIQIRKLSIALFAPGWVYEHHNGADFEINQHKFWSLLSPRVKARPVCGLPLQSSFCTGAGLGLSVQGERLYAGPWSNLSAQDILPTEAVELGKNPYFPGAAMAEQFASLAVGYDATTAYEGGSCLRIRGALAVDAQDVDIPSCRAVLRLFQSAIRLAEPVCVTFTFQCSEQCPIDPQLVLVTQSDMTRYLVLGPEADSGALAEADRSLAANLKSKYNLQPSLCCARKGPYVHYTAAHTSDLFEEATSALHVGSAGAGRWVTRRYVLCSHSLRNQEITEVRVSLPVRREAGLSRGLDISLGQIRMFPPKSLYRHVEGVADLRLGSISWLDSASAAPKVSLTLSWAPPSGQLEACQHYDILDTTRVKLLGRAYTNFFRVVELPVAVAAPRPAGEGAEPAGEVAVWAEEQQLASPRVEFAVVPCSVSGLRPPLARASRAVLCFAPLPLPGA